MSKFPTISPKLTFFHFGNACPKLCYIYKSSWNFYGSMRIKKLKFVKFYASGSLIRVL